MTKILSIIVLSFTLAISVYAKTDSTYIPPAPIVVIPLEEQSVKEVIEHYAVIYNQDPNLLLSVGDCESQNTKDKKGDWSTKQQKYLAWGAFQTHRGTFDKWKVEMGEPTLNYYNWVDQIKVSVWAFSKGETYRDDWTTYRAIIRGGTYSFYSKVLQGNYTIYCKIKDFSPKVAIDTAVPR